MPDSNSAPIWTKNNLAQFHTWNFLSRTKQTKADFDNSADVEMNRLKFWNQAASANARGVTAGAFASAMDDYFRQKLGASFESGYEWGKAVREIAGVMTKVVIHR